MSLWEFQACVDGFRHANALPDEAAPKPPTMDEHLDLMRRYG